MTELTSVTWSAWIQQEAADTMRAHGARTYPDECCGALLMRNGIVVEAFPLPNTTAEGAARRFLVGPDDYRLAESQAARRGARLAGFYHSHPDHPARPSQHDLAHAWPNLLYVIVAVHDGRPGEIRGWKLREDRAAFEEGELAWLTK